MSETLLTREGAAGAAGPESTEPPTPPKRRVPRLRLGKVPVRLVVFALLAVGVVVGLGWLLSWQSPVPVRSITVTGAQPVTAAQVQTVAGLSEGTPIRDIDAVAVAERVGALPGIEAVDVVLQRPFTIDIQVLERVPFAVSGVQGNWSILDSAGATIRQTPDRPAELPAVTAASSEAAQAGVVALAALAPELRAKVDTTTVSDAGTVQLTLRNGVVVDWGLSGQDDLKALTVAELLDFGPEGINVSVPERPAMTGELDLPKQNRPLDQAETLP